MDKPAGLPAMWRRKPSKLLETLRSHARAWVYQIWPGGAPLPCLFKSQSGMPRCLAARTKGSFMSAIYQRPSLGHLGLYHVLKRDCLPNVTGGGSWLAAMRPAGCTIPLAAAPAMPAVTLPLPPTSTHLHKAVQLARLEGRAAGCPGGVAGVVGRSRRDEHRLQQRLCLRLSPCHVWLLGLQPLQ